MKDYVIWLKRFLDNLLNVGQAIDNEENQEAQLIDLINKAHKEWQIAVNNFNHCSDDDMIDYSIYSMEAAEKRYVTLLKMARKEKLTAYLPVSENRVEV